MEWREDIGEREGGHWPSEECSLMVDGEWRHVHKYPLSRKNPKMDVDIYGHIYGHVIHEEKGNIGHNHNDMTIMVKILKFPKMFTYDPSDRKPGIRVWHA